MGDFKIGDRVGVGFVSHTCLKCELCNNSKENYCDQMRPVYNGIASDGSVTYGGFSKMIVAHHRQDKYHHQLYIFTFTTYI